MGAVLAEHHESHVVDPTPTKAKRGDVVAFEHHTTSSYINGPNETHTRITIGEVTSVTRDGQVKEFRDYEAGSPQKLERSGLEHASRYIIPGDKIDKAGVEELVRSRGVLAGSGNYNPFRSIEEAHAALKPHVRKKSLHMDIVTKSVDAAVNPVESEHPNGEFEVVLSTESLDRDDENLWADEWKQPLPARIHIDGDHGRSIEKTVGSAVPSIEGNRMVGKGTYAGTEYAQMVRQLVNEGHINSMSVTYTERKNQKDNSVQRELLNAAFVAIPANPEAVVLASKSFEAAGKDAAAVFKTAIEAIVKAAGGFTASGDNPQIKHDEMVQAIHDAAYQLGSQCQNEVAADSGASDGANKDAAPETSSSKDAGLPQESTEETTAATADKAAATADESADESVLKAKAAATARALAYLIKQNTNPGG
jgi:hypothetical protein